MSKFARMCGCLLWAHLFAACACLFAADGSGGVDFPNAPGILTRIGPSCFLYRAVPVEENTGAGGKGVKVLVTHDVHGHVFSEENRGGIGYPALQGYADALRREGWRVFLMDSGDAFSGSAVAQFDSGRSVAELMGKMGYRAHVPGNHAFDYNESEGNVYYYPDVLLRTLRNNNPGPFDTVCVNLTLYGAPVGGISPGAVIVHEEDGLRLIVAGVVTPYVKKRTNAAGVADFDFGMVERNGEPDHAATKARVTDMLARAVAEYDRPGDVVVVLSHVGWDESDDYAHGELSGKDLALVPNVDFVVDAHSHKLVPVERLGTAEYAQAHRYLTNVAEITLAGSGGEWERGMALKNASDFQNVAPSEEILAGTREIADRLNLGERLFELSPELDLSDDGVDSKSTPLGRFVCGVMRDITGADWAVYNAGGFRAGLSPGWVTAGGVYDMIPFQNNLLTLSLAGRDVLHFFANMPAPGTNAFPQFTGLTAHAWNEGKELRVAGVLDANGKPIDPDGTYVLVTNSFLAYGGDGYDFKAERHEKDWGDFMTLFVRRLRETGGPNPEALAGSPSLVVHPSREEAEAALMPPS